MTYPHGGPFYFDPEDKSPTTLKAEFNEDEIGRIYALAEIWAERCQALGVKPPPDPLRALLAAAENLYEAACLMDVLYERAMDEAEGGLTQ